MKLLKVTNDYVFKRIFSQKKNEDLLIDLLQAILPDLNIKSLKVQQEVQLDVNLLSDKASRLDILATLEDNTQINIEMQVKNHKNTEDRSLFYTTKLYQKSISKKDDYSMANKTIGIWILDYNLFDDGTIHEVVKLKRDFENIIFSDKIEIHFIQLTKFRKKCKRITNKLEEWLTFINDSNSKELDMINNEKIKKAKEEVEYLTGDAAERRLAEMREDAKINEKFYKMGIYQEGEENGIKTGIKQGAKNKEIQIAKNMLNKKLDINLIIELTGLSKEEIEKLK